MFHLTNAMLFVGALFLILGVALVARVFFGNHRGKGARVRDYFGPEYDRDLLKYSAFSESEDWTADHHSRFAPFRLRDLRVHGQGEKINSAPDWDHKSN